jgi:hypothetical protein
VGYLVQFNSKKERFKVKKGNKKLFKTFRFSRLKMIINLDIEIDILIHPNKDFFIKIHINQHLSDRKYI